MADELSNVGAPVSDEQIEDRILSTLPPSFHGARAAWETLPSGERQEWCLKKPETKLYQEVE
jgi:hypothetical protein